MPTTVAITIEEVAALVGLDPADILWAVEECGECNTDEFDILPCDDGEHFVVRQR